MDPVEASNLHDTSEARSPEVSIVPSTEQTVRGG